MSNQTEMQEAIGKIIDMASNDESLKNDLVNKTKETLSVFGINVENIMFNPKQKSFFGSKRQIAIKKEPRLSTEH